MKKEKMSKSDPTVSWPRCGAETRSQNGCRPVLLQESGQHLWKQQMQMASHLALSLGGTCSLPRWLPCSSSIYRAHPSHTTEWTESRRQLCLCKWHRPSYHTQERSEMQRGVWSGHLGWTVSAALGTFSPPPLPASLPQGAALLSHVGYPKAFWEFDQWGDLATSPRDRASSFGASLPGPIAEQIHQLAESLTWRSHDTLGLATVHRIDFGQN